MPISKEQLAAINFGYLNGSDLLQFAPGQVLTSQYDKYPDFFQTGCDMAYDEVKSELIDRYDINKAISNNNKLFKNQTGNISVNIPGGSYISRIILTWNNPLPLPNNGAYVVVSSPIIQQSSILDNSPLVQIGTTLAGNDIMKSDNIQFSKVLWVNKSFSDDTTLYFSIEGGNVDIDIACNSSKIQLLNKVASFTYSLPADTNILNILPKKLTGAPSIAVGTTLGGSEIVNQTNVSDEYLTLKTKYFENATTIYFTILGGGVNIEMSLIYDYVKNINVAKNSLLTKIIAIFALRNILGSVSGDNKVMQAHLDWADNMILKIKERQISLTIDAAPVAVASKAYTVQSSYKTIG